MPGRTWRHFFMKPVPPAPNAENQEIWPERRVNFFSRICFWWISPLLRIGFQRPLEFNDLWQLDQYLKTESLEPSLQKNYAKRRLSKDPGPALFWALSDSCGWNFYSNTILKVTSDLALIFSALILRYLINFVQNVAKDRAAGIKILSNNGIGFAVGIFCLQMLSSLCLMHYFHRTTTVGARVRGALTIKIYKKALRLSSKARIRYPNGRISNLLSTDVFRIDTSLGYILMLFTSTFCIVVNVVVLIVNIGVSALAGVAVLVIFTPITTRLAKSMASRRKKSAIVTDQRMRVIQEVFSNMRPIKFYAWEKTFIDRLLALRTRETHVIRNMMYLRAVLNSIAMGVPVIATILSFITFALHGNDFDAAKIFSSLALFNLLRMPLMILPLVIAMTMDGWVSIKRVAEFFEQDEIDPSEDPLKSHDPNSKFAIEFDKCFFDWEEADSEDTDKAKDLLKKKPETLRNIYQFNKHETQSDKELEHIANDKAVVEEPNNSTKSDSSEDGPKVVGHETVIQRQFEENKSTSSVSSFLLENISIEIRPGELVAVVGAVGSGKTSLFHALLGEMHKCSGNLKINGTVAYCAQQAWILNTTIRENILFGLPFDSEKYEKVVYACALLQDFEVLPGGDLTEVGERGITISGGQKQRINLARAAYSDADILLLDDPLSAVDAHVGKHIFTHCITDLLSDRTRILVTHQLNVCKGLDRIIVLQNGRIEYDDSFYEISKQSDIFTKHLAKEQEEEKQDELIKEDEEEAKHDSQRQLIESSLVSKERKAEGSLSWAVWNAYISAGGGYILTFATVFACIAYVAVSMMNNVWLTYWTDNQFNRSQGFYIGIYVMLAVLSIILVLLYGIGIQTCGIRSSRKLFQDALVRIFRAPMSFFDVTPIGRITNRFSKDVDTTDSLLQEAFRMFLMISFQIIGVLVLTVVMFFWIIIILVPLIIGFFLASLYYRSSARDFKRLDAVMRSYLFSHLGESLNGISTIRAYHQEERFTERSYYHVNRMNKAYFLTLVNARWLSMRLDFAANLLILAVAILSVTWKSAKEAAAIGLVLSYCMSVVGSMTWMVRQFSEVENDMNSVERLHEYGHRLTVEAVDHTAALDNRPNWPEKGEIVFDNVQMRYREGLPMVLKGLSFNIRSSERIGVVGRTGAGKSSIINALFRMPEITAGTILIDGIDTSQLGLHDLRARLAIIPQDPTMFQGTIRYNLDPLGEKTDAELYAALKSSLFIDPKNPEIKVSLDDDVEEEGGNFSLGQKQLLAMARALIRKCKVLVLDEASSSVDFETDSRIQETMRTQFAGTTIFCIAHRLKTIIHYDRVLVMEDGTKKELDTPANLFKARGIFRSMCDQSGITLADIESN